MIETERNKQQRIDCLADALRRVHRLNALTFDRDNMPRFRQSMAIGQRLRTAIPPVDYQAAVDRVRHMQLVELESRIGK